jgi:hypothetical protein
MREQVRGCGHFEGSSAYRNDCNDPGIEPRYKNGHEQRHQAPQSGIQNKQEKILDGRRRERKESKNLKSEEVKQGCRAEKSGDSPSKQPP